MANQKGRPAGPKRHRMLVTVNLTTREWLETQTQAKETSTTTAGRLLDEMASPMRVTLPPGHAEMNGVPIPTVDPATPVEEAPGFLGWTDDGRARFGEA